MKIRFTLFATYFILKQARAHTRTYVCVYVCMYTRTTHKTREPKTKNQVIQTKQHKTIPHAYAITGTCAFGEYREERMKEKRGYVCALREPELYNVLNCTRARQRGKHNNLVDVVVFTHQKPPR